MTIFTNLRKNKFFAPRCDIRFFNKFYISYLCDPLKALKGPLRGAIKKKLAFLGEVPDKKKFKEPVCL